MWQQVRPLGHQARGGASLRYVSSFLTRTAAWAVPAPARIYKDGK